MSDMRRIRDGARSLPVVQLGSAGMGAGGRRAGMGLLVENLVVRLARTANKMSIAARCVYARMSRQFLSQLDIPAGSKDGGNEVMPKVMYSDRVFINACFRDASFDVMPNIAGIDRLDKIPSALVMTDKKRLRLGRSAALPDVIAKSIYGASGNVDNSLFISLSDNDGALFVPVNILDFQTASLGNSQASISQKQNKRSIPEVCNILSYSIHVLYGFLNSIFVEYWKALTGLVGEASICLLKKGCVDRLIAISRRQIQAANSRSADGLSSGVHVRSGAQKLCIRVLRERRFDADNINKLSQSVLVSCVRLGALRFADEVQELIYSGLHGSYLSLSNANYIRE
jgi:hypothetical protein